jgi:hypothetical protein
MYTFRGCSRTISAVLASETSHFYMYFKIMKPLVYNSVVASDEKWFPTKMFSDKKIARLGLSITKIRFRRKYRQVRVKDNQHLFPTKVVSDEKLFGEMYDHFRQKDCQVRVKDNQGLFQTKVVSDDMWFPTKHSRANV